MTLPLAEAQLSARRELSEKFGVTASVGPRELANLLKGRPADDLKEAETRNEKKKARRMTGAVPGSCRARVDEVLIDTELESGAPDYCKAAEAA